MWKTNKSQPELQEI